jgi:dienelactone hydrolase
MLMNTEFITLNEERNVSLTAFLQPVGGRLKNLFQRPAVLILPGGGYHVCADSETDPVAYPYLNAGYHVFILRYSVMEHAAWPNPLNDYEQAISMIRRRAEEWHVAANRIAVIGFSAGGHLAACAAAMSENRPDAAILGYPLITADSIHDYLPSAPDAAEAVDEKTCPCFIFATRTDNQVPVENSLRFISALERFDIAFETHIYANGPHGLSTGVPSLTAEKFSGRYCSWVSDSIAWLNEVLGSFGPDGLSEPDFGIRINGNYEETLNLASTLQYVMQNPQGREVLSFFRRLEENGRPLPAAAAKVMTISSCLTYFGMGEETVRKVESELKAIKNR